MNWIDWTDKRRYAVLSANTLDALQDKVNELIERNANWTTTGGVAVFESEIVGVLFYQAMIKARN